MTPDHAKSLVFIVDDDPVNVNLLVDMLSYEGLNLAVATSGEEALKQVKAIKPDLILLDVIMPGIDGFETCRRLKRHDATAEIPVIFMTALTETVNTIKGFEVGGVDYITKPLQYEELFARVKAHLTIRRQQLQLQALNASKDTFFSIIAHDVKNPFTGFLLCIHLLEESLNTWNKDRMTEITALLRTSAEHLSALLDNLLTWSRIQRGMIDHHAEPFDLHLAVARNIALFTPNAKHKQISLSNSIQKQTIAYADVKMMDTVLRNLLSNALKFTSNGGTVDISARHDQQYVEVSVSDTGLGIAEEHLPKLFRVDAAYKRRGTADENGTGLGLILCKEFVERHGGRIWVESEEGHGSRFTVSLPRKETSASNEDPLLREP